MKYFEHPVRGTSMTCMLLDKNEIAHADRKRPLVIVCPGGAYFFRAFREGEPIAMRLMAAGFHTAILHYDVKPARWPAAALQLAAAVREVRAHAEKWGVSQVYIMGFSAGGHLCATVGTIWDDPVFHAELGAPCDWRPDGQLLCYPVITMGAATHGGSRENLLGDRKEELQEALSMEKRVTANTVRTFLWHTAEDAAVPVENSIEYALALRKSGVPFELHVFEKGGHGLATCDAETATRPEDNVPDNTPWLQHAVNFIRRGC